MVDEYDYFYIRAVSIKHLRFLETRFQYQSLLNENLHEILSKSRALIVATVQHKYLN